MDKPASANYPLNQLIAARWSPRAFEDRPVEPWKLCAMLEAARWAPSCFNEQPWRFFVGDCNMTPEALAKLQSLLMPGNAWALKAPVLLLSVAKLEFTYNGKPNRHAQHDVGLAAENMVLQAEDLGLVTHQMAGFYADRASELLSIPERYEPMAMMAVGYPGLPELLDDDLKARELAPRERKALQEMMFSDVFGRPFPGCFT